MKRKNSPIIMFINFYILFSGPFHNEIPYLVTNSLTHHTWSQPRPQSLGTRLTWSLPQEESLLPFVFYSLFEISVCCSSVSLGFSYRLSLLKLELWEFGWSLHKGCAAYFLKASIYFVIQSPCNFFGFSCLAWLDRRLFASHEKWILFCQPHKLVQRHRK